MTPLKFREIHIENFLLTIFLRIITMLVSYQMGESFVKIEQKAIINYPFHSPSRLKTKRHFIISYHVCTSDFLQEFTSS